MLSIPQGSKWYPLPVGKDQVLALSAEEKLLIDSAGAHIGKPSPNPHRLSQPLQPRCPKGLGGFRVPDLLGRSFWQCLTEVRKLCLSLQTGEESGGWLSGLPERAGGKGGREFSSPVLLSSRTGFATGKEKVESSAKCARTLSVITRCSIGVFFS